MADKSHIEWTDATWNPVTGCSIVSPGCTNCYAMKLAGTRLKHHPSRANLTTMTKAGPVWNGEVRLNEQWLTQPLEWKRPRMIFVCAHGDLFHEDVPDEWIDKVFAVMALAPQHTFQVLTKRSARMCNYLTNSRVVRRIYEIACDLTLAHELQVVLIGDRSSEALAPPGPRVYLDLWPLSNVWLGVSTERQQEADERIPLLLQTPAAIRFISAEPLLGSLDLVKARALPPPDLPFFVPGTPLCGDPLCRRAGPHYPREFGCRWHENGATGDAPPSLDWVIAGGESGPGARPMHPDWARSLRDQCAAAGVPFFFKQWGGWVTEDQSPEDIVLPGKSNGPWTERDDIGGWTKGDQTQVFAVAKSKAGRLLDGVEHNGIPAR